MARDPSRKKPKRRPRKEPIHPDLLTIAAALDEHRLETNSDGWFKIPWRYGENAVQLALDVYYAEAPKIVAGVPVALWQPTSDLFHSRSMLGLSYAQLDEYLYTLPIGHELSKYVRAAIRCRQLLIAQSSGGGHVYNDVLKIALEGEVTEEQMIKRRALDALGLDHNQNPAAWKNFKPFELAWKRGLFHAAYALKPVGA